MLSRRIEITAIFLFGLILFTWGLSSQEITGFDSRFYLFAQEMWRYGPSWFPMTYHQPYPDYPATSTFIIYLFAQTMGGLNKLISVLPTAIMAAVTLTLTYLIGALQNKRWGLYAVLLLLLTAAFLKSARAIALDMYPALFTTCCFYLIYSADKENKPARARWIYLFLFLGFITRGPIGLVMPAGVVCVYYLLDANVKKFFISGSLALVVLFTSGAALLLLAYHAGGYTFLQDVLRKEVLGRMDSNAVPRYFYFTSGIKNYALSFPLALLTILGVSYYTLRKQDDSSEKKFIWKLCGWMLVILAGMSIPGDKKIRYILPMLPAAALLAAYIFIAPAHEKYFRYLRWGLLRIFLLLPLIFLAGLAFIAHAIKFNLTLPYFYITILLLTLQALSFIAAHKKNDLLIMLSAALSFIVINITVIEPIELYIDRAHAFVASIESQRLQQRAQLVFYRERPDNLPIKYLINMPQPEQPLFITTPQALNQFHGPAFFVASESYFDELPTDISANFKVIAKDSLGHVRMVVFVKKH